LVVKPVSFLSFVLPRISLPSGVVKLATQPLSPSDVPRALLDEADTLPGVLAALAGGWPEHECLALVDRHGGEQRVRLGELWQRARSVQTALAARGVGPGSSVLIVMPTGVELLAAYIGSLLAGAVPGLLATPSNRVADARVYARRVGAIIENAQAAVLYCDAAVAEVLGEVADVLAATGTALLSPADVADGQPPPPIAFGAPDAVVTVQYSSGTTGNPKGVLLTHRALLNNIRAMRDGMRLTAGEASVNWVPLYHDMGLMGAFLLPLLCGCPIVLIPTMEFMRDPALWLRAIHAYRGALSWAPNFAYALCASRIPDAELAGLDLSAWRIAITAAEPALATTIAAFARRFAPYGFRPETMTPAWGLAENVVMATLHAVDQVPRIERIDRRTVAAADRAQAVSGEREAISTVSVGRCLSGCEVQVRDPAGAALPERGVGTIWLRSNCLFTGYRRNPALTAQTLVEGWLDTGDRGYLSDGELFFVSRDKDLIIVGGEKYAPHDVEEVINQVPGVREGCAAAFGVLNEEIGTEEVAAVIETRATDPIELAALRDRVRQAVTRVTGLALRHVLLVPPGGVEKTTSGKLARLATRRRYADRLDA
jgi:acyl-CoA synthetase (AMP-forming)/AMP-acid ligase II